MISPVYTEYTIDPIVAFTSLSKILFTNVLKNSEVSRCNIVQEYLITAHLFHPPCIIKNDIILPWNIIACNACKEDM